MGGLFASVQQLTRVELRGRYFSHLAITGHNRVVPSLSSSTLCPTLQRFLW